ncbi:hypothetical protein OEZ85_001797 [Tetradesmus obliquus]|uniref:Nitroreductase domain-containing protein n=1 Tax=Tetradesmus obliquus TaxID=3088 RepID=A0ABY8U0X6_TETOB|nr:hypothetical protein OEZ85_001797 [Tetradesmus obliquus]
MALLEAANWAPTHGKTEPWRFVVLGRQGMQALQDVTEGVYQRLLAGQPEQLQETLQQLQHDRQHRWSTPSHMVAICMARKPHPKHKFNKKCMPLWEELAACACAVQNMQLMATSMGLGAYWSSWHDDARDSAEMLQFLGMDSTQGDRCWGFLVLGVVRPEVVRSYRASRGPVAHKVAFRD